MNAIEEKKMTGLEELEQIFQEENIQTVHNKKKITPSVDIIIAVLLIAIIVFSLFKIVNLVSTQNEEMPDFLTEEEKKDWQEKEVDKDEMFIIVNTNMTMKDNKVDLNFVNPPYSAYPLQIKITDESGKKVLYQSKVINPGEYLKEVELKNMSNDPGEYAVNIHYTSYAKRNSDNVVGEWETMGHINIP